MFVTKAATDPRLVPLFQCISQVCIMREFYWLNGNHDCGNGDFSDEGYFTSCIYSNIRGSPFNLYAIKYVNCGQLIKFVQLLFVAEKFFFHSFAIN